MDNELKSFIFIGRSGCGKGSQVERLIKYYTDKDVINEKNNFLRLETGARFREFAQTDNYTARKLKAVMEAGDRLPDCFAIWTWSTLFIERMTGAEHIFCDGCPRSLLEAQSLEHALNFYNRQQVNVVYIDVSREESRRRLLERGRADDQPEDIEKRLDWFEQDVLPAVEYYRNNKKYNFIELDGEQTREKIHADLVAKLESWLSLRLKRKLLFLGRAVSV